MAQAAAHRSAFMLPWEETPHSVATGILDDETYDWRAVVEGMLMTGGRPLVVGEELLLHANQLAVSTTRDPGRPDRLGQRWPGCSSCGAPAPSATGTGLRSSLPGSSGSRHGRHRTRIPRPS